MRPFRRLTLAAFTILVTSFAARASSIMLVGTGTVPGTATDLSGQTVQINSLEDPGQSVPGNILGGFGSGIAYTGYKDFFITVPDRGPFDGDTNPAYLDRLDIFRFTLDLGAQTVTAGLVDTHLFVDKSGSNFVGESSAFDQTNPLKTYRFDPEGIRVSRLGNLFVSDEYGPYIREFSRNGTLVHRIKVPDKFLIDNPNADGDVELMTNTKGRQANRGMEGLAISPDGTTLWGLMQNPLIQDGALDSGFNRVGINCRLLRVNLRTETTQEYVYQLDSGSKNGLNEILAVNDHQFLVIERDGKGGTDANTKKIFLIDTSAASDVSSSASLPQTCTPGVDCPFTPVTKTLFIDLLSPDYGLAGPNFPEKIEGLAFGPDLEDGRHVLYVSTDNDLDPTESTYIFAFAIAPDLLPNYQAQKFGL